MVNVKPEQFQKIWSALITPTNEDESVNYEALERIVELQIQDGAEGFYCCGSSGEGLLLTLEERKQVLEHVLKAGGRAGARYLPCRHHPHPGCGGPGPARHVRRGPGGVHDPALLL